MNKISQKDSGNLALPANFGSGLFSAVCGECLTELIFIESIQKCSLFFTSSSKSFG
jgi:hypothetical protein